MSKKKNKFKRSKHNHGPIRNIPPQNQAIVEQNSPQMPQETQIDEPQKNIQPVDPEIAKETATYAYVRKDVKKILWFILLIIVLLTAAYFIQAKTTLLQAFGDWLYKIAHIQTL